MIHFGLSTPLARLHHGLRYTRVRSSHRPRSSRRPRAIPRDLERSRAIPSDPEDRERELGNTASDALTTVPDLIARDDETPQSVRVNARP